MPGSSGQVQVAVHHSDHPDFLSAASNEHKILARRDLSLRVTLPPVRSGGLTGVVSSLLVFGENTDRKEAAKGDSSARKMEHEDDQVQRGDET